MYAQRSSGYKTETGTVCCEQSQSKVHRFQIAEARSHVHRESGTLPILTQGGHMSTRNTPILQEITDVLFTDVDEQTTALNRLENHFHDRLLVDAGSVVIVGEYAEQLRLRITEDERATVLDYIAEQRMVVVTIDVVEDAINKLLGQDRFIEP